MKSTYNPGVHKFAVFTVWWTLLLFIAGALVTSKDAALSVPDWPKSFGTWFPSLRMLAGGAFFEHSHRVIAGALGFLVLTLAVLLWGREPRSWMRWLGVIAVGGVVAQPRPSQTISRCGSFARIAAEIRSITERWCSGLTLSSGSLSGLKLTSLLGMPWYRAAKLAQ